MGASVAQSVKHLTLDLRSGLALRVVNSSLTLGSTLGVEPTLNKEIRTRKENRTRTHVLQK